MASLIRRMTSRRSAQQRSQFQPSEENCDYLLDFSVIGHGSGGCVFSPVPESTPSCPSSPLKDTTKVIKMTAPAEAANELDISTLIGMDVTDPRARRDIGPIVDLTPVISDQLKTKLRDKCAKVIKNDKDADHFFIFLHEDNGGDDFWQLVVDNQIHPTTLKPIFNDLFTGVSSIHRVGRAHADVKLENALVKVHSAKRVGPARIIDYGLSVDLKSTRPHPVYWFPYHAYTLMQYALMALADDKPLSVFRSKVEERYDLIYNIVSGINVSIADHLLHLLKTHENRDDAESEYTRLLNADSEQRIEAIRIIMIQSDWFGFAMMIFLASLFHPVLRKDTELLASHMTYLARIAGRASSKPLSSSKTRAILSDIRSMIKTLP